jgi:hypothetical protein
MRESFATYFAQKTRGQNQINPFRTRGPKDFVKERDSTISAKSPSMSWRTPGRPRSKHRLAEEGGNDGKIMLQKKVHNNEIPSEIAVFSL